MSKCPDARDCLRDLVVPAMEVVADKVNFTLSFIGSSVMALTFRLTLSKLILSYGRVDANDSIHCKHGPTECLGDMLALCGIDLYPKDPIIYLGFSNCMISSYSKIPSRDLIESCALEHGINFDALNACISEEGKGLDLLKSSVERSEAAGVTKSCTVRVDREMWCIRDGGEWKDCSQGSDSKDLVKAIEGLFSAA